MTRPSTFAHTVGTGTRREPAPNQVVPFNQRSPEENEQIKQEREKHAFSITAKMAPTSIKKLLENMHAKEIREKCQTAINEHFKEGHIPKVHGVSKQSDDVYKLHCHSERDPQLIEEMNWNTLF